MSVSDYPRASNAIKTFSGLGVRISEEPVIYCNPFNYGGCDEEVSADLKQKALYEYNHPYWRGRYPDKDYLDWTLVEIYYDGYNEIYAMIEKDGEIVNVKIMSDG